MRNVIFYDLTTKYMYSQYLLENQQIEKRKKVGTVRRSVRFNIDKESLGRSYYYPIIRRKQVTDDKLRVTRGIRNLEITVGQIFIPNPAPCFSAGNRRRGRKLKYASIGRREENRRIPDGGRNTHYYHIR